ncbi:GntR family transcriptional regulator [Bradyrhizobium arachidis]|uniref:GntR family transcriptional regulator n=1 Tax=Bradyrhizobium arachidis TaxID=858423 RepID=A0AAE7TI90_9BRAD|nr:GntR family transcriptional regulator [Bradyrhizobium arachidis]QOZ69054.1 GntR family transcriptional regulator [Bradyrhizobium arachidis]SFV00201.1 DNA-binding transcriptional regulator, GntR family [Bradyrhizobium arachidis]
MLHEEVVGRIRAILLDGEIPPGARIPERELCERLQISRTPLREALKVLAAEGLVQLLPHRGSRAAKLTDKDMRDLFEVCQGLEALAGELACERISDAGIGEIAAAHEEMVRHYREGDLIQYYRGNRAIHEAIVTAAGNPALAAVYASVTARIRRARYVTPTPQRWALAVKEHEAILNALQRRDGAGLAHILRAHLRHKREEVLQAGFAETDASEPTLKIA